MEIYKLLEATLTKTQPDHPSIKNLRRDQLLDQYDEAITALNALIKTKENEISYRSGLLDILDKSKSKYDEKLQRARQAYVMAKKYAPDSLDLRTSSTRQTSHNNYINNNSSNSNNSSVSTTNNGNKSNHSLNTNHTGSLSSHSLNHHQIAPQPSNRASYSSTNPIIPGVSPISTIGSSQSPQKNSDLNIPLPSQTNYENRSSLDQRLSEFLKTFPNLTQAGLGPATDNNNVSKPSPGYYTQQQPQPQRPPQNTPLAVPTPPMMAMLRFPPPNMSQPPPNMAIPPPHLLIPSSGTGQENDVADMELSDADEANSVIPMVASAMQKGAGGKQGAPIPTLSPYSTGQMNPVPPYAPRMNALPFDPSIMDSRVRDHGSTRGSSRDKSDKGSSRHSGGSSSSGSGASKHGSDRNKYPSSSSSSSHSSSRSSSRRH